MPNSFFPREEEILALLQKNGLKLKLLSSSHQADKSLVMTAVSQNGKALAFASEALRNDRDVVLAAVSQYPLALEHASKVLRGDREIVLLAARKNAWAINYTSDLLQDEDAEVVVYAGLEQSRMPYGYLMYLFDSDNREAFWDAVRADRAEALSKLPRPKPEAASTDGQLIRSATSVALDSVDMNDFPDDNTGLDNCFGYTACSIS